MAVQTRVRRIARNPRVRKTRKRMTPKQIKFFGTARQRAALKSNRRRKPRTVARHRARTRPNPKPRVRTRTRVVTKIKYRTRTIKANAPKRRKRRSNPAPVILTLGATNPRRSKTMAKRKRKVNRSHHHRVRARSRNPKRVTRRRRNPVSRRRISVRRRSNPMSLFGGSGAKHTVEVVGGVLAGMAGTKFVPTMLPASLSAMGGSTFGPVLVSGVSAYALKKLAEMVKKGAFSDAVFLGGLAQTGSMLLNSLVPSVWGQFGISGLGAFMPGRFPVPQNPILAGAGTSTAIGAPNARIGVSGLGRAFQAAF